MSDSLTLARRLSALDDDALTSLLARRQVAARDVRDFFDVADALLEPASIRLALRSFDRATIEFLASSRALPSAAVLAEAAPGDARVPGDAQAPADAPAPAGTAAPASPPFDTSPEPTPAVAPATVDSAGLLAWALASPPVDPGETPAALLVFPAVAQVAAEVLAGSPAPDAAPHAAPASTTTPASTTAPTPAEAERAVAAERAFTALSAVSELSQQLRVAPVRIRARGGVSATDDKKLAALLGVEPADVSPLIAVASAARLVTIDDDTLVSTTAADEWSLLSPGRRWLALAQGWLAELDAPYRTALVSRAPDWAARDALRDAFATLYPAADAAMLARLDDLDRVAALLGTAVDGSSTAFGRAALDPDAAAAAARLDAELPPEVGQVYLQHDLSVIAPGPLSPPVDARLRRLADIETRGVASAYRISPQSIDRALATGETESSLREFLEAVSLTGLPQAVDYLVAQGGRRHGLVRVRSVAEPDQHGGLVRTLVRTSDHAVLGAIAVDHTLSPLALRREGTDSLSSRVDPVTVYWMLADARYPVLAEDAHGNELVLRRTRIVAPAAGAHPEPPPAALRDIVLRLRTSAAQAADDSTAWTTRLLDKAVRARTPMTVDVRMPDGRTTELRVTPLSLSNGRLRCVDVRAGVERTVPVSNIVRVATG